MTRPKTGVTKASPARRLVAVLREPLVHFLLIGAAIFGAFNMAAKPEAATTNKQIVISSAEVEQLGAVWAQRWRRVPAQEELDGLIEERVREEVYYREALALGLDRDDVAIRRLLRNKLEFVTQDIVTSAGPEPADLAAYYAAHPERYMSPATVSFSQIYFASDRRGGAAERDATLVLASLGDGRADAAALAAGDGQMFDTAFRDQTVRDVEAMFGPGFAAALPQLQPGKWSGPVASAYGMHLVRIDARREGGPLPFAEVAEKVRADLDYDRRQQANIDMYRNLRARYEVIIEPETQARTGDGGQD